jgi:hypothetical protein
MVNIVPAAAAIKSRLFIWNLLNHKMPSTMLTDGAPIHNKKSHAATIRSPISCAASNIGHISPAFISTGYTLLMHYTTNRLV